MAEITTAGNYATKRLNLVTADAAVLAAAGTIWAVLLTAPSADSDIILYDNASAASGTAVFQASALNGTSTPFYSFKDVGGIPVANGIYADITGSGAQCYVWFD